MRSRHLTAGFAAALLLLAPLIWTPQALADYTTNVSTTAASDPENNTFTQYGVTQTLEFTVNNTGNPAAGRPTGTVNFTVGSDPGTQYTSARSVQAVAGSTATQSKASLTFNANTPSGSTYNVTATYVPASNSGFTGSSAVGNITVFPRPTTTTVSVSGGQATATVTASSGSTLAPTGSVEFRYGNGKCDSSAVARSLAPQSSTTASASTGGVSGNRITVTYLPSPNTFANSERACAAQ